MLTLEKIKQINKERKTNYGVINNVIIDLDRCIPGRTFYISKLGDFIMCSLILCSEHEFIWPAGKSVEVVAQEVFAFWEAIQDDRI